MLNFNLEICTFLMNREFWCFLEMGSTGWNSKATCGYLSYGHELLSLCIQRAAMKTVAYGFLIHACVDNGKQSLRDSPNADIVSLYCDVLLVGRDDFLSVRNFYLSGNQNMYTVLEKFTNFWGCREVNPKSD